MKYTKQINKKKRQPQVIIKYITAFYNKPECLFLNNIFWMCFSLCSSFDCRRVSRHRRFQIPFSSFRIWVVECVWVHELCVLSNVLIYILYFIKTFFFSRLNSTRWLGLVFFSIILFIFLFNIHFLLLLFPIQHQFRFQWLEVSSRIEILKFSIWFLFSRSFHNTHMCGYPNAMHVFECDHFLVGTM